MGNNKLFQTPAMISGVSTLKDRTLKLTVYVSRELIGEEKAKLFDLEQKEGWFLFSENSIQETDVPKEDAKVEGQKKSPSERLYNTLFVFWNQNYSGQSQSFNEWRANEMEKIIDSYKQFLK